MFKSVGEVFYHQFLTGLSPSPQKPYCHEAEERSNILSAVCHGFAIRYPLQKIAAQATKNLSQV
jgi:hypothetical protein